MNSLTFVGIGEVLYDIFEDGTESLGGAPLNFAVHVHQLASRLGIGYGTIVSCISSDQRGIGSLIPFTSLAFRPAISQRMKVTRPV